MKKILITGNSGYIGSHLTKILQKDYIVNGLDINLPIVPVSKFHQIDINSDFYIDEPYDCVIHLAALVKVNEGEKNPISYYKTNVFGTINVLNKIKTSNFIFSSTGVAEKCQNAYGISKRAAEDCVKQLCNSKTDYTIFRFYNVIGSDGIPPTNPDGLFYNLMSATTTGQFKIFGDDYNTVDGTCIRDYVHVNEICHSIKLAIENPSRQLENLGHGVGHSVKEIVDLFKKTNNVTFDVIVEPRRIGDLESSVLDNPSTYLKQLYSLEDLLKV